MAETPPKGTLLIVFLVVFIDLLGFGIVLPILPRLAEDYLRDLSPAGRGVMIGILFSSFSLMQFLFAPMWGRISDRIGRRPILLLGLVGSVVFYALFGFAVTLPASQATLAIALMLLSRIGAGVSGATIATAAAVIADCTTPENRAKGMALIGIAFGAGFALGPAIAYIGMELFSEQPWIVGAIASVLSALALVLAVVKLKETRPGGGPAGDRRIFSFGRTMDVLKNPAVGPLVLVYFLVLFAFANFEATLSLFTESAFKISERDNYRIFAYVGCVLFIAGGLYRPIVKRRPETLLLGLGVALIFFGMAGLALVAFGTSNLFGQTGLALKPLFYFAMTVAVVGFAFINPSVSALISKRADPHRQGEVLGVNQSCASLARILGPFAGSIAFGADPSRILPYAIATATLLLVLILLPKIRTAEPKATATG